jgi:outer membrane protein assembly factor BamB
MQVSEFAISRSQQWHDWYNGGQALSSSKPERTKMIIKTATSAMLMAVFAFGGVLPGMAQGVPTISDWLTWGYDQQRTGWNRGETVLSKNSVGRMKLLWTAQLPIPTQPMSLSTLTAPIVVSGVFTPGGVIDMVYTVGINDTVFAMDVATGRIVWQKSFPNPLTPLRAPTVNCANTEQATPVADKKNGVLYFTTSDGKLRGLALADGVSKLKPADMVSPFSRNWSLNLVGDIVYTAAGRGCGGSKDQAIEPGTVAAMDVSDPEHPALSRFYTGVSRPAGPWGAGGPVLGPQGLYVETADGPNNPGAGIYGNSVVAVRTNAWGLKDSFVPPNWRYLNAKDLDLGSSGPVIFKHGKRTLVAASAKEGVVYLLDAENLGGPDHMKALYTSQRLGNDDQTYWGHGVWGGMTVYETGGTQYLYVPMWGPPAKDGPKYLVTHGDAPNGSIMAFKIGSVSDNLIMTPAWISRDLDPPAPPVVANGVVFALQAAEHTSQHPDNPEGHGAPLLGKPRMTEVEMANYRTNPSSPMTLFALDAETGKELWSSKKSMNGNTSHFSEPVVAGGRLFVVDHNAHMFAFGLHR